MALSNRALVLAAIAAWLLWGRKSSAAENLKNLTGTKVDRTHTWSGTTEDWAKTRFGAALAAVKANGETDDDVARKVALSILTHWSIETGAGVSELNYNLGNILATGDEQYYIAKDISGHVYAFRAFDFLQAGADAYVKLLAQAKYHDAAVLLGNKPEDPDWYIALGKAGWFNPTQAQPPQSWESAAAAYAAWRALLQQYADKQ